MDIKVAADLAKHYARPKGSQAVKYACLNMHHISLGNTTQLDG